MESVSDLITPKTIIIVLDNTHRYFTYVGNANRFNCGKNLNIHKVLFIILMAVEVPDMIDLEVKQQEVISGLKRVLIKTLLSLKGV